MSNVQKNQLKRTEHKISVAVGLMIEATIFESPRDVLAHFDTLQTLNQERLGLLQKAVA